MTDTIRFVRLSDVDTDTIATHMADPRIGEHMPLMPASWNAVAVAALIADKEARWRRDGLGHWAILHQDRYVGWGGFQKEGDEWDFGLVLTPAAFGLGRRIVDKALAFAIADARIPYITFLLPPSRRHLGALHRLGAVFIGEIDHDGARFLKFRLNTS